MQQHGGHQHVNSCTRMNTTITHAKFSIQKYLQCALNKLASVDNNFSWQWPGVSFTKYGLKQYFCSHKEEIRPKPADWFGTVWHGMGRSNGYGICDCCNKRQESSVKSPVFIWLFLLHTHRDKQLLFLHDATQWKEADYHGDWMACEELVWVCACRCVMVSKGQLVAVVKSKVKTSLWLSSILFLNPNQWKPVNIVVMSSLFTHHHSNSAVLALMRPIIDTWPYSYI